MDAPSPSLERKPSIDSEPKTLLAHEMKLAREAAVQILNTHTKEEALQIFLAIMESLRADHIMPLGLQGLAPVTIPKHVAEEVVASDGDEA